MTKFRAQSQHKFLSPQECCEEQMASFYSNDIGDNHMLPNDYLLNQKLPSYFEPESIGPRDEMMFIPPSSVEQINHHGLSLSLGSQELSSSSSLLHFHPGLNHHDNSSLCSVVNTGPRLSHNGPKNLQQQYLSFDSVGKNGQFSDFTLCHSKYLEPAQGLLDELVSVHRVSNRVLDSNSTFRVGPTGMDAKGDVGVSGEVEESSSNAPRELSVSERHELQNKMTKLVSMLDEVDRRYKQYRHQMQAVASSFDSAVGPDASRPYTSLALRTISRQFRTLRDAIKKQILSAQKGLGIDPNHTTNYSLGPSVVSRLRHVDQQLRQQKSLLQFGSTRQTWRPQRGLPENAVSVLRAWLFEHFLHPYPKDSEKAVLARETGLTRSQVANWFINARVRLWKPMIEEMYKEEFGSAETELIRSSHEHITTNVDTPVFNQLEFQESIVPDNHVMNSFGLTHTHSSRNQVTLALGLQGNEKDSEAIGGDGIQPTGNEYFYVPDPSNDNQNNRFSNTHLLSDFVV